MQGSGPISELPAGVLGPCSASLPSPEGTEFLEHQEVFITCFLQATCLHVRLFLLGLFHYAPSQLLVVRIAVVNLGLSEICPPSCFLRATICKEMVTFSPSNNHCWQLPGSIHRRVMKQHTWGEALPRAEQKLKWVRVKEKLLCQKIWDIVPHPCAHYVPCQGPDPHPSCDTETSLRCWGPSYFNRRGGLLS